MTVNHKQNKLPKRAWDLIKYHLDGHIGNVHHECGRPYEYLATLRPMTMEEHFPNGVHCGKFMHGIPEERRIENIETWKRILGDDYNYFLAEDLVG